MITVGIDASRNRSGGAKVHLRGILEAFDPAAVGVRAVHLWSYRSLLDAIPDAPWLIKHSPPALERALPAQVWWQYRRLPEEAARAGCDVLLNTDAGSVCRFRPAVVMSRDMLSYEPGEAPRYGLSKARARLELLRAIQTASLRRAEGAIFLTRYAADVIMRSTGPLASMRIIPHGVTPAFRMPPRPQPVAGTVRCLYVSNTAPYKHQWHVVRAFRMLRDRGHDVVLTLAGGGRAPWQTRLESEIVLSDPRREFVRTLDAVPHDELPSLLAEADLFVFASSCENMPNTLVEAMAAGLPIACSNRGPMPEILQDAGVYFDPENPDAIARAVESLLTNPAERARFAARAFERSRAYSWEGTAAATFAYLRDVAVATPPVKSI